MKRSDLEAMGLTKEQIDSIMETNGADIENAKANLNSDLEAIKAENENLKKMVKDRDKSISDLKESAGMSEELKAQIEKIQSEAKAKDKEHQAEIHRLKVDAAVDKALSEAGAKSTTAAKALLKDLDKAQFGEDGKLIGLTEQITALQTTEETSFLFKTQSQGAPTGATPAGSNGAKPTGGITKEQFRKMSYNERVELYNTDKAAYDAMVGQE